MLIEGGNSGKNMDVIDDGTYRGKVRDIGNIVEYSRIPTPTSYGISTVVTNAADTNDNPMMIIQNATTGKYLVITRILASASAAGVFRVKTGVTYSSAGAAGTAYSLKSGSSVTDSITCYYYSGGLTLAGTATQIDGCRIANNGVATFTFSDALIIPYGKAVAIYFKGAAGSESVEIGVQLYSEEV